jgi:ribosome-associated protein
MSDPTGDLQVSNHLVIPAAELEWRFSGSGGPGGQHANTANTRVELVWHVAGSGVLSASDRDRLVAALGDVVRVVCDDERSQWRNRVAAYDRLADDVSAALRPRKKRRATRPSRGSKERRLKAKKQRSDTKKSRRWKPDAGRW